MFPAVEKALEGKQIGEKCRVRLAPDDGFGDYDAELVHIEPREKFPEDIEIGMQFEGEGEESRESIVYTSARTLRKARSSSTAIIRSPDRRCISTAR